MPRLDDEFLRRIETFCDRALDLCDALHQKNCSQRIVEQVIGSATSVGANMFEASEAMSSADFCRCSGIALRELNETRFWIRLIGRRGWVKPERLVELEQESDELRRIIGAMVARTKGMSPKPHTVPNTKPRAPALLFAALCSVL